MSLTFRATLCLLALSLSLVNPALAQSQSTSNSPTLAEVKDLAVVLVRAGSEQEQEQLLASRKDLLISSLLAALKALANPLIQKGDYAGAAKISQLAVRIAERIGDRLGLGNALCDL